MTSLVAHVLHFHGLVAYVLVGGVCFAESAFIFAFFVPGETALVFGGVLASEHRVGIVLMVAVGVAATTLGYFVGYAIGRLVGPRLFEMSWIRGRAGVARTRQTILERGTAAVFFARFIPFVRAFMPGIAGASGVEFPVFARANIIGALVWAPAYTLAGFAVGAAYHRFLKDATTGAEIAAAVVVAFLIVHWVVARRRARGASESRPI